MISGNQLRQLYLDFYKKRGHAVIPSAPLIPVNDPTTLFTSSGMQPLVPNLLGQPHPEGTRLVDSQKSFRAQDIEEVGDNRHTTFFEMLGNWSLGDYFKKEQLAWVWQFFTKEVGLPTEKLHVTLFEGNDQVPRDEESALIWKSLGVSDDHIHYYPAKKNWWSRSGAPDQMPPGEPGGPDSEVFFDFGTPHDPKFGDECHVNCDCGRFLEIGNSVFMQYQKQADGSLKELSQKNVDFGGGLERILAVSRNEPDIFRTDLFWPLIKIIEEFSHKKYSEFSKEMRIIADHIKASTFLVADGVIPNNKAQGYVLRRLLRRATLKAKNIDANPVELIPRLIESVLTIYEDTKHFSNTNRNYIDTQVIDGEIRKFDLTLEKGLKEFEKYVTIGEVGKPETKKKILTPKDFFYLYSTFGFPYELSKEEAEKRGIVSPSIEEFELEEMHHQELSRTASAGMFKGGLADQSETVTKYHTATHLLQQALRDILGPEVHQAGSNLTSERLRFDFTYDKPLTQPELKQVEDIVNENIAANLPITMTTMPYEDAIASGALAFFKEKYPEKVNVYRIGDYSKEVCGGPHVTHTGEIGKIKVIKQESLGSSLRRVYLKLESVT